MLIIGMLEYLIMKREMKIKIIIGEELSYEIIGILDNGKTGSSPYRLDLSNENVTRCDSEGNVYGTGYDEKWNRW